jgi:hypothetical protein
LPILRVFAESGAKIVRFFFDWKDSRRQGPDAIDQDLDDVLIGSGKLDLDIARKSVKRMSAGEKCLDALTRIRIYTKDFRRKMKPNARKARSAIETFDQTVLNPAIESLKREIRSFENMFQRSNLYHQSNLSRKMYYLAIAAFIASLSALLISAVSLSLSVGFANTLSLGNATRSLLIFI